MIDIVNRQRRRKINQKHWRDLTARAIEAIGNRHKTVTIVFVSDSAIRKLNKQFRDTDRVTDVLSFPAEPEHFENQSSLGEIVISTDRAGAQAKTNGLSLQNEIEQLILHGLQAESEMLGRSDLDFHPPALAMQYMEEDRTVFETGKPAPQRLRGCS